MTSRRRERDDERLISMARGDRLREPPEGVLRRAIALRADLARPAGVIRWVAELLFDSGLQPLPAGVRKAASPERRLLFSLSADGGEPSELDLRLRRGEGRSLDLTGQLAPALPGLQAVLSVGRSSRRCRVGDQGEFLLRRLPRWEGEGSLELVRDGAVLASLDLPPLAEDGDDEP